jgi:hypothetical protein
VFNGKLKQQVADLQEENRALRARLRELNTSRATDADSAHRLRRIIQRLQKELEVERGKHLRDDGYSTS